MTKQKSKQAGAREIFNILKSFIEFNLVVKAENATAFNALERSFQSFLDTYNPPALPTAEEQRLIPSYAHFVETQSPYTEALLDERYRQEVKWGKQWQHPDGTGEPGSTERAQQAKDYCDNQFKNGKGT